MYSAAVLDHFKNPRNAGEFPEATAVVELSNPVCGDVLRLSVRCEAGRVAEARFQATGCTTAIACGSLATELLTGRHVAELPQIGAVSISQGLGGLPPATLHGAQLAADAIRALAEKLK